MGLPHTSNIQQQCWDPDLWLKPSLQPGCKTFTLYLQPETTTSKKWHIQIIKNIANMAVHMAMDIKNIITTMDTTTMGMDTTIIMHTKKAMSIITSTTGA